MYYCAHSQPLPIKYQLLRTFSTPPHPENFSSPPSRKFLNFPPKKFSTPTRKFLNPPEKISTPKIYVNN